MPLSGAYHRLIGGMGADIGVEKWCQEETLVLPKAPRMD